MGRVLKTRICRSCGERPVAPSNVRRGNYDCAKCIYHKTGKAIQQKYYRSEKGKASKRAWVKRYRETPRGKAVRDRLNAKRVRTTAGVIYMRTPEQAQQIHQMQNQFRDQQRQERMRVKSRLSTGT